MELHKANSTLKAHNCWRRGEYPYDDVPCDQPCTPKELGEAIDTVTEYLDSILACDLNN